MAAIDPAFKMLLKSTLLFFYINSENTFLFPQRMDFKRKSTWFLFLVPFKDHR